MKAILRSPKPVKTEKIGRKRRRRRNLPSSLRLQERVNLAINQENPPHSSSLLSVPSDSIPIPWIAALTWHDGVGMAERRRPIEKKSTKVESSKSSRSSLEMTLWLVTASKFMIFQSMARRSIE
jgi:hypothetical protein